MGEDVHGIINLNVHVIADGSEFIFLSGYSLAVLALDLPSRGACLREAASDDDALAILFGLVGFLALILHGDRHFRDPKDVVHMMLEENMKVS